MIRLPAGDEALTASERYGLDVLVDLSRLVPVDDAAADVVGIEISDGGPSQIDTVTAPQEGWHLEVRDGTVRLPRALLRWVTDVAGAGAEQRSVRRDRHRRVPSSENPLASRNQERDPLVSRAAVALRRGAAEAAGRRALRLVAPWPDGRRWAAAFTHDLDAVAWWPLFPLLRLAELARKADAARLLHVAVAALGAVGRDPIFRGVESVLALEREAGIASTWFVLCGTPTLKTMRAGDLTYTPESRAVVRILRALAAAGAEIGLHGSFETLEKEGAFTEQRERLERLTARAVRGVRQHYIRVWPGATQRVMSAQGFAYDATFGFPDRNGFRLGAADVVPAWDASLDRQLALQEIPLVWMDRSLSKYQGVEDPGAWVRDALELASRCRDVEGLWVGLWHPNLTPALGYPGAPDAYAEVVRSVLAQHPFVGTLGAVAAWRSARRGVRIRGVGPDGRADAYARERSAAPLMLEDSAGRAMEAVWGPA